ncbi:uncharacterized protein STEHIDRAFT_46422 [Stereum hirsutum FP-91666 SS1]|uniref:uncharacterized protein n=1 Tax=Stereum hirsutum (strain FP-91666) TaxID=721885 RepID=UPI000440B5AC|nr:uncharacterized protein STEHIDRAFT_46422 [Stereum hirsutum FP-91666 SS1]EIM91762.1 hypothetical protein STEHIDRAFT_46422 [Stereum hirsutum FP-91666 SS1]
MSTTQPALPTPCPPTAARSAIPVLCPYSLSPLLSSAHHIDSYPSNSGLFSFASTTLILSLYNCNTHGTSSATPNLVVGMALFCGGLAQLLAGMWEFAVGNTFGATAFSSYGAFWLSYATILIPGSGIADAFTENPSEEPNAIGIFLISWMIVTFIFFLSCLRRSIGLLALFGFLTITFMLLAIANFTGKSSVTTAGGVFGAITAFIAYYCGAAELLTVDDAFMLPLGHQIAKRND